MILILNYFRYLSVYKGNWCSGTAALLLDLALHVMSHWKNYSPCETAIWNEIIGNRLQLAIITFSSKNCRNTAIIFVKLFHFLPEGSLLFIYGAANGYFAHLFYIQCNQHKRIYCCRRELFVLLFIALGLQLQSVSNFTMFEINFSLARSRQEKKDLFQFVFWYYIASLDTHNTGNTTSIKQKYIASCWRWLLVMSNLK